MHYELSLGRLTDVHPLHTVVTTLMSTILQWLFITNKLNTPIVCEQLVIIDYLLGELRIENLEDIFSPVNPEFDGIFSTRWICQACKEHARLSMWHVLCQGGSARTHPWCQLSKLCPTRLGSHVCLLQNNHLGNIWTTLLEFPISLGSLCHFSSPTLDAEEGICSSVSTMTMQVASEWECVCYLHLWTFSLTCQGPMILLKVKVKQMSTWPYNIVIYLAYSVAALHLNLLQATSQQNAAWSGNLWPSGAIYDHSQSS